MDPLGQQLKTERERRSLPLEQVSMSIRIRRQYLDAIERHDWSALPEPVFTKGYIQSYAQFLQLDSNRFLSAYAREMRIARPAPPTAAETEGEAKAILERLVRTQGQDLSGFWWRHRWTALVVVGACAGAAVWRITPSLSSAGRSIERPVAAAPATHRVAADDAPAVSGTTEPTNAATQQLAPPAPIQQPPVAPLPPPRASSPTDSVPASSGGPSLDTIPAAVDRGDIDGLPLAGERTRDRLAIPEFGVGTGVSQRVLVGRSDHFEPGTVVWFWTQVLEGRRGDVIKHVWLHEGRVVGVVPLSVGGPQWRTQSRWQLGGGSPGLWSVEARDADDRVLAATTFRCGPLRASPAL